MKSKILYTSSLGRHRKHRFVPAIMKNHQIHQFQAPVVMQPSRMFEPYLYLNLRKRDIKNRAWGQSIPALSSRPVPDFHWLKTSRVLSRSQWSDYSVFVTETRCITLWSYHPDGLLFRFCIPYYRTCVRNCQDMFSALFVTNTLEKFKGILYVPGHCPESLHRIVRRIGLKMCRFCHHRIAMCSPPRW